MLKLAALAQPPIFCTQAAFHALEDRLFLLFFGGATVSRFDPLAESGFIH